MVCEVVMGSVNRVICCRVNIVVIKIVGSIIVVSINMLINFTIFCMLIDCMDVFVVSGEVIVDIVVNIFSAKISLVRFSMFSWVLNHIKQLTMFFAQFINVGRIFGHMVVENDCRVLLCHWIGCFTGIVIVNHQMRG